MKEADLSGHFDPQSGVTQNKVFVQNNQRVRFGQYKLDSTPAVNNLSEQCDITRLQSAIEDAKKGLLRKVRKP